MSLIDECLGADNLVAWLDGSLRTVDAVDDGTFLHELLALPFVHLQLHQDRLVPHLDDLHLHVLLLLLQLAAKGRVVSLKKFVIFEDFLVFAGKDTHFFLASLIALSGLLQFDACSLQLLF